MCLTFFITRISNAQAVFHRAHSVVYVLLMRRGLDRIFIEVPGNWLVNFRTEDYFNDDDKVVHTSEDVKCKERLIYISKYSK